MTGTVRAHFDWISSYLARCDWFKYNCQSRDRAHNSSLYSCSDPYLVGVSRFACHTMYTSATK